MKRTNLASLCAVAVAVSIVLCNASVGMVKADTVDDTQTTETTETTESTETIETTEATEETEAPAFTVKKYSNALTRYVTASKITKYAEPTTSSKKKGTLAFQKKVKLVGEVTSYNGKTLKTKWYQLNTGEYIKNANLSKSKPALVSVTKYKKAKIRYTTKKGLKVRKYPSTAKSSKTLCTLGKGAKIKLVGKVTKYRAKKVSGTWYKVKVTKNGKSYTGYVRINDSSYVSKTKPNYSSSSSSSSSSNSNTGTSTNSTDKITPDWGDINLTGK
jgi:hypothetical protein